MLLDSALQPTTAHRCRCVLSCPCSILFQRGIYEPESFTKVQKYGLGMQVTTDQGLADYLKKVLTQMQGQSKQKWGVESGSGSNATDQ